MGNAHLIEFGPMDAAVVLHAEHPLFWYSSYGTEKSVPLTIPFLRVIMAIPTYLYIVRIQLQIVKITKSRYHLGRPTPKEV